jgi:threonine/homoserine/homoserine lactone efflux protein
MGAARLGFAIAATLLILSPGPDTMLVMRNSLRGGSRVGVCTAAGTMTGLLTWAVGAALGLSSLLAASRVGYDVLRLIGGGVPDLAGRDEPAPAPSGPEPDGRQP